MPVSGHGGARAAEATAAAENPGATTDALADGKRGFGSPNDAEGLRLGFAGLGWIGAQRMQVLAESGLGRVAAVCEPDATRRESACASLLRPPEVCSEFAELVERPLDGIVIATPNALHEPQAAAAMQRGIAVFCQKPLALSAAGTRRLVRLAASRRVPLGVDWSYRHLAGVAELKERIEAGELGRITAVELCFHNAWGPDAAWYYDLALSGGGCLLDLGCHLLDLCHWLTGAHNPVDVRARCFRDGRRLAPPVAELEDLVTAEVDYASGEHVRLACSWRASVGCGAVIGCRIFGTAAGAEIRNLDGSFYDFEVLLHRGAERRVLGGPPDAWPGRALLDWAGRVARGASRGDGKALVATADVIETIYGRNEGEVPACES